MDREFVLPFAAAKHISETKQHVVLARTGSGTLGFFFFSYVQTQKTKRETNAAHLQRMPIVLNVTTFLFCFPREAVGKIRVQLSVGTGRKYGS